MIFIAQRFLAPLRRYPAPAGAARAGQFCAVLKRPCHAPTSAHEQLDDMHRQAGWWLMRDCCLRGRTSPAQSRDD